MEKSPAMVGMTDLPISEVTEGPGPVNFLVNFNGGSFLPLVVRNLTESSSTWATLDPSFSSRNEYPTFLLNNLGNQQFGSFSPTEFARSRDAELPSSAYEFVCGFKEPFFASLDRVFLQPLAMSHRERLFFQYFHGFANFFSNVPFDPARARKVFFPAAPHFHWDIAMSAALQVLGWDCFSFTQSPFNDRLLLRKMQGPRCSSHLEPPPSQYFSQELETKRNANVLWTKKVNSEILTQKASFGKKLSQAAKGIRWTVAPKRFAYFSHSPVRGVVFGIKWAINWWRLRRWLVKGGLKTVPEDPFVYFALHLQPERSTVPDAGAFWYQAHAISELRRSLPPEVLIVVGEHPRQVGKIGPDLRQKNFRSKSDYDILNSVTNVRVAHWTLRSEVLVEHALLTASCTGSVGWDSLLLGKPAVCFGPTWYSNAEACLEWKSGQDFRERLPGLLDLDSRAIRNSAPQVLEKTSRSAWPGLDVSVSEYPSSQFEKTASDWENEKEHLARELSTRLEKFVAFQIPSQ